MKKRERKRDRGCKKKRERKRDRGEREIKRKEVSETGNEK